MSSRGGSARGRRSTAATGVGAVVTATPSAVTQLHTMMGREVSDQDIARMAGAGHGDRVHVQVLGVGGRTSDRVTFIVKGADGRYDASLQLEHDMLGRLVMRDVSVEVPESQRGQGVGAAWFARHVAGLSRVGGIHSIVMEASRNSYGKYNGYYTWARLGVDGPLPSGVRSRLPSQLSDARSVLDLMAHEGGPAYWREHGDQYTGEFDLAPGSRSRAVLSAYFSHS